jgi:hypothetical protein
MGHRTALGEEEFAQNLSFSVHSQERFSMVMREVLYIHTPDGDGYVPEEKRNGD